MMMMKLNQKKIRWIQMQTFFKDCCRYHYLSAPSNRENMSDCLGLTYVATAGEHEGKADFGSE